MREALGQVRDFLAELLGEDSNDREAARRALGIDLAGETAEIGAQAKANAERAVPVGSVSYFAMATPPAGYLRADGAAVSRTTYSDLFTAIGTTFGEGDGSTTFHLPNLMGRFPEGHVLPGTVKAAGLPNVTGLGPVSGISTEWLHVHDIAASCEGAIYVAGKQSHGDTGPGSSTEWQIGFDASRSHPLYGASDTVQPPALTLLPCIKAVYAD